MLSECLLKYPFTVRVQRIRNRRGGQRGYRLGLPERSQGWTIVDYKTDNAGDEELVARHSAQVTEYVKAWKQIFPDQRCAGYLWSTRSGAYLPITEME